jgi:hypothetical protein
MDEARMSMRKTEKKTRTIREPELTVVTNTAPDLQSEVVPLPLEVVEEKVVVVEEKELVVEEFREVNENEEELEAKDDGIDGLKKVQDNFRKELGEIRLEFHNSQKDYIKDFRDTAGVLKEHKVALKGLDEGLKERQVRSAFLEAKVDAVAGETSKMAEAHTSAINTHSVIHAITLGALAVLGVVGWKGRTPKA